jgi:prepilin peptidase CpaA
VLWLAGWLGGGDVKLLGATSLWLGVSYAVPFLFVLSVIAPILAAGLMVVRRATLPPAHDAPFFRRRVQEMAHSGRIAYGVPIAIAGLITLPRLFL